MAIVETIGNQFAARVDKLFDKCVLYWPGDLETASGFSILPTGATVTPYGTWSDSTLPNGKTVKQFNGSTNHIDVSDNAAWFFGTDPVSFTFWVNPPNVTGLQYIWNQRTDGNNEHACGFDANVLFWNNYNTGAYQWRVRNGISAGVWSHITLVRESSTQKAYFNKALQTNQGASSGSVLDYTGPFSFGCLSGSYYWSGGNIKDFMIFKRALSVADIGYIMDRTSPYRYGAGLNYPLLYKR